LSGKDGKIEGVKMTLKKGSGAKAGEPEAAFERQAKTETRVGPDSFTGSTGSKAKRARRFGMFQLRRPLTVEASVDT
jgi:hypothetical protein